MIGAEEFRALLEPRDPAISLYIPAGESGGDPLGPQTLMRELIGVARGQLAGRGIEDRRIDALLAPAEDSLRNTDFPAHREPGIALFLTDGWSRQLALPQPVEPAVVAGHAFHVRPLLPLVARNRRFFLLALSAGKARLLACTPFACDEVPLSLTDNAGRAQMDSLPAGADEGSRESEKEALLLSDWLRLANSLRAAIGADQAPILLAAEPRVAGHFSKAAKLPQLLEPALHLNPFAITTAELHARAVAAMEPSFATELDAVLDQVNARLGTAEPTVAIRFEEILLAADEGRVDALVLAEGARLWGRYEDRRLLATHGSETPDDDDLLNLAAVLALRNGARAFVAPAERLPRQSMAVATLRY